MLPFELVEPETLDEAFQYLGSDDPAIRPIGGGTALMLMMKAQFFEPVRLVSLRHLQEPFHGIALEGDVMRIGAMTNFAQLEHSAEIARHFPVVVRAMRDLANVRVRNVATVGGNLAHGDPHLDLPPIWMSQDAEVLILSARGQRTCSVKDLLKGYYETDLASGELIAELRVPLRPDWRSVYAKVTTRSLHDWPALGLAIALKLNGQQIEDARVVLSGALDKATRLVVAEGVLRGQQLNEQLIAQAGDAAVTEAALESDSRGSADYKSHLLRVHLGRAINHLAYNYHD